LAIALARRNGTEHDTISKTSKRGNDDERAEPSRDPGSVVWQIAGEQRCLVGT
jgi:hypothetical protein